MDLFYFSIETLATVGYGDMHPQTHFGHFVAATEIFIGMSLLAVMTGLIFARFSRPRDRTVVVPDLRGMGLSAKPARGYDKKTQAGDIAGILDALKIERAALVTHDIGNMVGYAFAALHRDRVTCFVPIDAPLPGVGPWEEILKNPLLWHFRFGGPDMERLVAGRERIYLDRF